MSLELLFNISIDFETMWQKKQKVGVKPEMFYTVSLENLKSLKVFSNRLQEQKDLRIVSKIKNG